MAVLIFANGNIEEVEWIRPYLAGATAVIAADGGATYLLALDYVPDVVIGDMDSLSLAERDQLERAGTRFIIHPAAKDETDLELALSYVVVTYEDEILLFGTLGGRLDQTLANILLLAHPVLKGRRVYLVNQYERAWLVEGEARIQCAMGDTISLIPLGGDTRILATTGLRWPLMNDVLAFGPARGVSNVMTAEVAIVTVESGRLLCIHTRRKQGR